jgi:hypothetical protein
LEGYPNLAWAEYLPPWAFLDFFAKYLPLFITTFMLYFVCWIDTYMEEGKLSIPLLGIRAGFDSMIILPSRSSFLGAEPKSNLLGSAHQ